jgi:hypothetical protein
MSTKNGGMGLMYGGLKREDRNVRRGIRKGMWRLRGEMLTSELFLLQLGTKIFSGFQPTENM